RLMGQHERQSAATPDVGSAIGFEIATNMLGPRTPLAGGFGHPCGRSTALPSDVADIIRGESAQDGAPSRRLAIAKHQAFSLACENAEYTAWGSGGHLCALVAPRASVL